MQRLGLHLTDRCQLDCAHCLRDPAKTPVDLPLSVVEAVLQDAVRYGIERVSLTGGEPTLHPEFARVLDAIASFGLRWDMVSNGQRFDKVVDLLEAAPARRTSCAQVVFSVDGAIEATHDAIRGPGQHRAVLEAVALAVAVGLPFGMTMTLHAGNVAELEALGFEAARFGARHVSFAMMQPTGTHLDARLGLPPATWEDAHARLGQLAAILRIPVIASEGWPHPRRMQTCAALRGDTLHVDQHGRLTLCCLHSDVPGDPEGRTVAGPANDGLVGPHRQLLAIQERAMTARLDELQRGDFRDDPWAEFECNGCLRRFGMPHWTGLEGGVGGAVAGRARWRGAWDAGRPRVALPLVPRQRG